MKIKKRPFISRGFTLVELLTVIAIIGVLAGILIPVVGAARKTANKAKTRAQFNQWATGLQNFRAEYGYWPQIDAWSGSGGDVNVRLYPGTNYRQFAGALDGSDNSLNRRRIPFYVFSENERQVGTGSPENRPLVDAFENPNIFVAVDRNNDGVIARSAFEGTFEVDANRYMNRIPSTGLGYRVAIWSIEPTNDMEGFENVASWE